MFFSLLRLVFIIYCQKQKQKITKEKKRKKKKKERGGATGRSCPGNQKKKILIIIGNVQTRRKKKKKKKRRNRHSTVSTDQTKKKKEKKEATDWISPCASTHGYFHHLPIKFFSLSFLLILKRKYFVGSREKTPGPYQFFFLSSPNQTLAKKVFIFIFFPKFFFPFSFQSFQLVKFLIVE